MVEQQNEATNKDFSAQLVNTDVWENTLSAYDFRKNTFNTSDLLDDIGTTNSMTLHSLDRVGDEGVDRLGWKIEKQWPRSLCKL